MTFIACVLLLAGVTAAQDFRGTIATFEKPKDYAVKYDKFKDLTVITTPRRTMKSKGFVTATAYMAFDGQTPTGASRYYLTIGWTGDKGTDEIVLLVDDQPLVLTGRSSSNARVAGGRYAPARIARTFETTFTLTKEQTHMLGNAKKIEFQIVEMEGSFTNDLRQILLNLSRIDPR